MQYLYLALVIIALVAIAVFIKRSDDRARDRHRDEALRLLETSRPDPRRLRDTLKGLRLYSGRLRKNKELTELYNRLLDKHERLLD